jgi:hypothetical protein
LITLYYFFFPVGREEESAEDEGWETVHRRLKFRASPSQKSLENLSEVGTGGKNQLTRSMSVPDSTVPAPKERRSHPPHIHHKDRERERASDSKATLRAVSEQNLPNNRQRVDSRESEKENSVPKAHKSPASGDVGRPGQADKVRRDIFGVKEKQQQGKVGAWGKMIPDDHEKKTPAAENKVSTADVKKLLTGEEMKSPSTEEKKDPVKAVEDPADEKEQPELGSEEHNDEEEEKEDEADQSKLNDVSICFYIYLFVTWLNEIVFLQHLLTLLLVLCISQ